MLERIKPLLPMLIVVIFGVIVAMWIRTKLARQG